MRRRSPNADRSLSPGERLGIAMRDRGRCSICGEDRHGEPMEVDHRVSRHDGGWSTPENSALAHRSCNRKKGPHSFIGANAA